MLSPDTSPEPVVATGSLILIVNRDLFFGVRLRQALQADGWSPRIVPSTAAAVEVLSGDDVPALVVADMAAGPDWSVLVAAAGATAPPTPVLAFGAHRDVDAFRAAKVAGVNRVISNGDFHRDMVGTVRRYARGGTDRDPTT